MTITEGIQVGKRECWGAENSLSEPVETRTVAIKGRAKLICVFNKGDDRCRATLAGSGTADLPKCPYVIMPETRPVVFLLDLRPEKLKPIISCEVPVFERKLTYDPNSRFVTSSPLLEEGHEPVKLNPSMGFVLEELMTHQGDFVDKEQLFRSYNLNGGGENLYWVINRLRMKLGEKADSKKKKMLIHNKYGKGYKIIKAEAA